MKPLKKTDERHFSFHWGSGVIVEEAQVESPWHSPTIQLLKFTSGPAVGQISIRFCHYTHTGKFNRSPLMMSTEDIHSMRAALKTTPELAAFLRTLVIAPD